MKRKQNTMVTWIFRLIAVVILLQTLYFKFTAAPESVYIFSTLGMEPWGRIGIGLLELMASLLILVPYTTAYGAILGVGLMSGALFFHFTRLGIVVQNDSGQLFIYAWVVLISCLVLFFIDRVRILTLVNRIKHHPHE
jgi:hypothetical protein